MSKGTPPDPSVGRGAVLYDDRPPERRDCCDDGGRCLHHVTAVYQQLQHKDPWLLYEVRCGTHTTRQYIHGDDLLALFTPAGWRCATHHKPTYRLTRRHGVDDHHDLMQVEQ